MFIFTVPDRQTEQELLGAAYEKYKYFMWYIANDIVQNAGLAESIVQDAFRILPNYLDKIQHKDTELNKKFLSSLIRQKCFEKSGAMGSWQFKTDGVQESGGENPEYLIAEADYDRLITSMTELEESRRVLLEYHYLYDMTEREMAFLLEMPLKKVHACLQDSMRQVVERLGRTQKAEREEYTYGSEPNNNKDQREQSRLYIRKALSEMLDEELDWIPREREIRQYYSFSVSFRSEIQEQMKKYTKLAGKKRMKRAWKVFGN